MISRIFYSATFFLLLSSSIVYADYIQGHVVQIDREQGVMAIVLCDKCSGEAECTASDEHLAEKHKDAPVITVVASWFPRCLVEGMMVFARGMYSVTDPALFEAVEVFPHKRLGHKDKTGVRSRFRHHRERGHQKGQHD